MSVSTDHTPGATSKITRRTVQAAASLINPTTPRKRLTTSPFAVFTLAESVLLLRQFLGGGRCWADALKNAATRGTAAPVEGVPLPLPIGVVPGSANRRHQPVWAAGDLLRFITAVEAAVGHPLKPQSRPQSLVVRLTDPKTAAVPDHHWRLRRLVPAPTASPAPVRTLAVGVSTRGSRGPKTLASSTSSTSSSVQLGHRASMALNGSGSASGARNASWGYLRLSRRRKAH